MRNGAIAAVALRLATALAFSSASAAPAFTVAHITDVHIDPFYVTGAVAGAGCYCETHDTCARMPASCVHTSDPALAAGPFGMPEDDCATPPALWEAAMGFMDKVKEQAEERQQSLN